MTYWRCISTESLVQNQITPCINVDSTQIIIIQGIQNIANFLQVVVLKTIQEVSWSSIPDSTLTVNNFNTTFCVESLTVMVQIYQDAKNKEFTQKIKPVTTVCIVRFPMDLYT